MSAVLTNIQPQEHLNALNDARQLRNALLKLSDATDEYMRTPTEPIFTWKVIEARFRDARREAHALLVDIRYPK